MTRLTVGHNLASQTTSEGSGDCADASGVSTETGDAEVKASADYPGFALDVSISARTASPSRL